jgi:hypothetical protein
VAIDGVRVAPKQVKIVPPKEKKKRTPPTTQENKKRQQMTVAMLHDKIKTLTDYTHAFAA